MQARDRPPPSVRPDGAFPYLYGFSGTGAYTSLVLAVRIDRRTAAAAGSAQAALDFGLPFLHGGRALFRLHHGVRPHGRTRRERERPICRTGLQQCERIAFRLNYSSTCPKKQGARLIFLTDLLFCWMGRGGAAALRQSRRLSLDQKTPPPSFTPLTAEFFGDYCKTAW